jgi:hypothetical protein
LVVDPDIEQEHPRDAEAEATPRTKGLRALLLNLHLYGGLITCWYLILFGVTSLGFNHPGFVPEHQVQTDSWEATLSADLSGGNLQKAEQVRDQLDMFGWPLPWAMWRGAENRLHFDMSRPGKDYSLIVDEETREVSVRGRSLGLWQILRELHGLSGVPNSKLMTSWFVYTEITTWIVLFSALTGVYLWFKRQARRRVATIVLGLSAVVSLAFMAFVYWVG